MKKFRHITITIIAAFAVCLLTAHNSAAAKKKKQASVLLPCKTIWETYQTLAKNKDVTKLSQHVDKEVFVGTTVNPGNVSQKEFVESIKQGGYSDMLFDDILSDVNDKTFQMAEKDAVDKTFGVNEKNACIFGSDPLTGTGSCVGIRRDTTNWWIFYVGNPCQFIGE